MIESNPRKMRRGENVGVSMEKAYFDIYDSVLGYFMHIETNFLT